MNRIISLGGFATKLGGRYDLVAELAHATTTTGKTVYVIPKEGASRTRFVNFATVTIYLQGAENLQRGPATLKYDTERGGYRQTGLE